MKSDQPQSHKSKTLVSAVWEDGTLAETVFDQPRRQTSLLISDDAGVSKRNELQRDNEVFRAVLPSNNLIRHQAIRFAAHADEFGSVDDLAAEIERYIARYVRLSAEARSLVSAYVLLSWVYDAFNELPYLRFRGDYGTGKTRALLVIGSITYKPFFASGASTVSPIFHTLDTFRGTLIFDEADFRFTDEKAELVKILNNGNAKGFPVLRTRMSDKRAFDPQAFVVYGPKIVGMRRRYEDRALESRFLSIDMAPGRASGVPINLPATQEDEALALRNKLLMYRFRYRNKVALDTSLADPSLEPRTNQILLPLLSVVPSDEARDAIRCIAGARETELMSDRGMTTEGRVLEILADKPIDRMPLKNIASAFSEAHGADFERPITSRYVGALLRRLGLRLYKSEGIYVIAPGQRDVVAALAARYGIDVDSAGTTTTAP